MQTSWHQIEKMLTTSAYNEQYRERILQRVWELEAAMEFDENEFYQIEMNKIITDILNNQLDPITHLSGYGQKDIINHLKKLK